MLLLAVEAPGAYGAVRRPSACLIGCWWCKLVNGAPVAPAAQTVGSTTMQHLFRLLFKQSKQNWKCANRALVKGARTQGSPRLR